MSMEIFWETIASYNAATWPIQILFTITALVLTALLYYRPSRLVRTAMKIFMAAFNGTNIFR